MHIQIEKVTGRIISINAPQTNPDLISLDVELTDEIQQSPHLYVWSGSQFVLDSVIQEELKAVSRLAAAKRYLAETDFYITRKLETGTAVPSAVGLKRHQARAILVENLPDFEG
ncbi:hypothetical protein [Enterovibrio calviensis]|uniref:hypothetical protein n=1 Tax=Enterovibrio calviensis TaxID=91359 RepID=UPI000481F5AB|nr:hypothetical protein [Enterovibrio calviensis]